MKISLQSAGLCILEFVNMLLETYMILQNCNMYLQYKLATSAHDMLYYIMLYLLWQTVQNVH